MCRLCHASARTHTGQRRILLRQSEPCQTNSSEFWLFASYSHSTLTTMHTCECQMLACAGDVALLADRPQALTVTLPASSDMHPGSSVVCASVDVWIRPDGTSPRTCDADSGADMHGDTDEQVDQAGAGLRQIQLDPAPAAGETASVQFTAVAAVSPADSDTVRKTLDVFVTDAASDQRPGGDGITHPAAATLAGEATLPFPAGSTPTPSQRCADRKCAGESPAAADVMQVTPRQHHRYSTLSTPLESGSASSGSPAGCGNVTGKGEGTLQYPGGEEERRQRALARASLKRRQATCTASPPEAELCGSKRHRRATRALDMAAASRRAGGGAVSEADGAAAGGNTAGAAAGQAGAMAMPELCNSDSPMIHGAAQEGGDERSTEVTPQLLAPACDAVKADLAAALDAAGALQEADAMQVGPVPGQAAVAPTAPANHAGDTLPCGAVHDVDMHGGADGTTTPCPDEPWLVGSRSPGPEACEPTTTELWGAPADARPVSGTPLTAASLPPILDRALRKGHEPTADAPGQLVAAAAAEEHDASTSQQPAAAEQEAVHACPPAPPPAAVVSDPAAAVSCAAEVGGGLPCAVQEDSSAAAASPTLEAGTSTPPAGPATPGYAAQSPQLATPSSTAAPAAGDPSSLQFKRFCITPVRELRKRRGGRPVRACVTTPEKSANAPPAGVKRVSPRLRHERSSAGAPAGDAAVAEAASPAAVVQPSRPRRSSRSSAPSMPGLSNCDGSSPCTRQLQTCAASVVGPETAEMPAATDALGNAELPGCDGAPPIAEMPACAEVPAAAEVPVSVEAPAPAEVPVPAEVPAIAEVPVPAAVPAVGEVPACDAEGPTGAPEAHNRSLQTGDAPPGQVTDSECTTAAPAAADAGSAPSTCMDARATCTVEPAVGGEAVEPVQKGHAPTTPAPVSPEPAAASLSMPCPPQLPSPTLLQRCEPPGLTEESPCTSATPGRGRSAVTSTDGRPASICEGAPVAEETPASVCCDALDDVGTSGLLLKRSPPVLPTPAPLPAAAVDDPMDGMHVAVENSSMACPGPPPAVPAAYDLHEVHCAVAGAMPAAAREVLARTAADDRRACAAKPEQDNTAAASGGVSGEAAAHIATAGGDLAPPPSCSAALFDPDVESPRSCSASGSLAQQLLCMHEGRTAALAAELADVMAPVLAPMAAQAAETAPEGEAPASSGVLAAKRVILPAQEMLDESLRRKRVLSPSKVAARNWGPHRSEAAPQMHTSVRPAHCSLCGTCATVGRVIQPRRACTERGLPKLSDSACGAGTCPASTRMRHMNRRACAGTEAIPGAPAAAGCNHAGQLPRLLPRLHQQPPRRLRAAAPHAHAPRLVHLPRAAPQ